MTGNDYLKLLIGDLAFQLASAKSKIDELESPPKPEGTSMPVELPGKKSEDES